MRKHFPLSMIAIIVVLLCDVVAFSQSGESAAEAERITRSNEIVLRTFKAGNEALQAKNYDEAIKQYDEGITADPTHPGLPILLTNKSVALRARGVERYNAAIRPKVQTPGLEAAKTDFRDAAEAATKAVEMLKAQAPPSDATEKAAFDQNKYYALAARAQAMRLLVSIADPTQAHAGLAAYQEYIEVETAPAKKAKAQLEAARMLLDAGADNAFAEYQKVLSAEPDNPDALLGAGLALFASGDQKKKEEAINYLQRFLSIAPATHALRNDAQAALDVLKAEKTAGSEAGYEGDTTAPEGSKARYEGDTTAPSGNNARYEGDTTAPTKSKARPTRRNTARKRSRP